MTFMLTGCAGFQTGNQALDATVTTATAIVQSDNTLAKCKQGHAQDRVNCRKKKQAQTNAISKSLKKHINNKK